MNLLRLSFLLVLVFSLVACGDDDEGAGSCTQADWVGTYTGTSDCDGLTEDVTVTITANGSDAVDIVWETPTVETEYDPINLNGCNLNQSDSTGGLSISVDATLNGDNLTLTEIITNTGNSSTCELTATRN